MGWSLVLVCGSWGLGYEYMCRKVGDLGSSRVKRERERGERAEDMGQKRKTENYFFAISSFTFTFLSLCLFFSF